MLDFENALEDLLGREVQEEAGITIYPKLTYLNSVFFIRPDGIPVILIKMAAKYKDGEVKLEEGAFDDFVWVTSEEIKNHECIDGIKEEVARTINLFSSK